jgi:hypothetical protein
MKRLEIQRRIVSTLYDCDQFQQTSRFMMQIDSLKISQQMLGVELILSK